MHKGKNHSYSSMGGVGEGEGSKAICTNGHGKLRAFSHSGTFCNFFCSFFGILLLVFLAIVYYAVGKISQLGLLSQCSGISGHNDPVSWLLLERGSSDVHSAHLLLLTCTKLGNDTGQSPIAAAETSAFGMTEGSCEGCCQSSFPALFLNLGCGSGWSGFASVCLSPRAQRMQCRSFLVPSCTRHSFLVVVKEKK